MIKVYELYKVYTLESYLNSILWNGALDSRQSEGAVQNCFLCEAFLKLWPTTAGKELMKHRHTFRDFYLLQSGIDAGAAMVMTSFNTASGERRRKQKLMRGILATRVG